MAQKYHKHKTLSDRLKSIFIIAILSVLTILYLSYEYVILTDLAPSVSYVDYGVIGNKAQASYLYNSNACPHPIVFLGDSITAGADWSALFGNPCIINAGVPGATTDNIISRLDEVIVYKCNPRKPTIFNRGMNGYYSQ